MRNSGCSRGSFAVQSWLLVMGCSTEFCVPPDVWQPEHAASLVNAPPGWLLPVTRSSVSWHEVQAEMPGRVFHWSTFAPVPAWHLVQFESTAGNSIFHHSCGVWPM